ncbi:hypothetical protein HWV62_32077 [Athelia sp. TMB]|nr:hypothetical protein HWV62_32077 [Athelia sp. TMB]
MSSNVTSSPTNPTVDGQNNGGLTQAAAIKLALTGDIVLLAFLAVAALLALPRTLARVSNLGHVFWHSSQRTPTHRKRTLPPLPGADSDKGSWDGSDNSHTLTDHYPVSLKSTVAPRYPTHVRAVASLPVLNKIASFFARRWSPGYSLGQFLITQVYNTVLTSILTYRSNVFTDPGRAGLVAMSQLPLIFVLAMKNNVAGWLVGVGYEKMNYLHRYAGQLFVLFSDVHTLGYIYTWALNGTLSAEVSKPSTIKAFVALAALNFLFVTSTGYMRANYYRIFFVSHLLGMAVFLVTVCIHLPSATPAVLAAAFLYAADHLLRALKTRAALATVRAMPDLSGGTTRIEVPTVNSGWRAGQHVRVRILSFRMGLFGWAESHPFTIASVSGAEEGMVLLVKNSGAWTGRLYELAKLGGYGENEGRVRVLLEGPYGGGNAVPASFSAAILTCGGSGISYVTGQLQDLLARDAEGRCSVRSIDVVWSVQDPASVVPLIPLFTACLQQAQAQGLGLTISVHYTRATPGVVRLTKDYRVPGLTLATGRPRIAKVLDGVLAATLVAGGLRGVVVGVCGPVGLGDEVARAVQGLGSERRAAVGGVEVAEEVFGW